MSRITKERRIEIKDKLVEGLPKEYRDKTLSAYHHYYFVIDFDPTLSEMERGVYRRLEAYQHWFKAAYPSMITFSASMGVDIRTIRRTVTSLMEKDMVKKIDIPGETSVYITINPRKRYHFLSEEDIVNPYYFLNYKDGFRKALIAVGWIKDTPWGDESDGVKTYTPHKNVRSDPPQKCPETPPTKMSGRSGQKCPPIDNTIYNTELKGTDINTTESKDSEVLSGLNKKEVKKDKCSKAIQSLVDQGRSKTSEAKARRQEKKKFRDPQAVMGNKSDSAPLRGHVKPKKAKDLFLIYSDQIAINFDRELGRECTPRDQSQMKRILMMYSFEKIEGLIKYVCGNWEEAKKKNFKLKECAYPAWSFFVTSNLVDEMFSLMANSETKKPQKSGEQSKWAKAKQESDW